MSIINLITAARSVLSERGRRRRAYAELVSLDDRSLADIGIHRSQIPAIIEGWSRTASAAATIPQPTRHKPRQAPLGGDHRLLPRI